MKSVYKKRIRLLKAAVEVQHRVWGGFPPLVVRLQRKEGQVSMAMGRLERSQTLRGPSKRLEKGALPENQHPSNGEPYVGIPLVGGQEPADLLPADPWGSLLDWTEFPLQVQKAPQSALGQWLEQLRTAAPQTGATPTSAGAAPKIQAGVTAVQPTVRRTLRQGGEAFGPGLPVLMAGPAPFTTSANGTPANQAPEGRMPATSTPASPTAAAQFPASLASFPLQVQKAPQAALGQWLEQLRTAAPQTGATPNAAGIAPKIQAGTSAAQTASRALRQGEAAFSPGLPVLMAGPAPFTTSANGTPANQAPEGRMPATSTPASPTAAAQFPASLASFPLQVQKAPQAALGQWLEQLRNAAPQTGATPTSAGAAPKIQAGATAAHPTSRALRQGGEAFSPGLPVLMAGPAPFTASATRTSANPTAAAQFPASMAAFPLQVQKSPQSALGQWLEQLRTAAPQTGAAPTSAGVAPKIQAGATAAQPTSRALRQGEAAFAPGLPVLMAGPAPAVMNSAKGTPAHQTPEGRIPATRTSANLTAAAQFPASMAAFPLQVQKAPQAALGQWLEQLRKEAPPAISTQSSAGVAPKIQAGATAAQPTSRALRQGGEAFGPGLPVLMAGPAPAFNASANGTPANPTAAAQFPASMASFPLQVQKAPQVALGQWLEQLRTAAPQTGAVPTSAGVAPKIQAGTSATQPTSRALRQGGEAFGPGLPVLMAGPAPFTASATRTSANPTAAAQFPASRASFPLQVQKAPLSALGQWLEQLRTAAPQTGAVPTSAGVAPKIQAGATAAQPTSRALRQGGEAFGPGLPVLMAGPAPFTTSANRTPAHQTTEGRIPATRTSAHPTAAAQFPASMASFPLQVQKSPQSALGQWLEQLRKESPPAISTQSSAGAAPKIQAGASAAQPTSRALRQDDGTGTQGLPKFLAGKAPAFTAPVTEPSATIFPRRFQKTPQAGMGSWSVTNGHRAKPIRSAEKGGLGSPLSKEPGPAIPWLERTWRVLHNWFAPSPPALQTDPVSPKTSPEVAPRQAAQASASFVFHPGTATSKMVGGGPSFFSLRMQPNGEIAEVALVYPSKSKMEAAPAEQQSQEERLQRLFLEATRKAPEPKPEFQPMKDRQEPPQLELTEAHFQEILRRVQGFQERQSGIEREWRGSRI